MKCGSPFLSFAVLFRQFLKSRGYATPSDFYRDLKTHMKEDAPSIPEVYAAFYGTRRLPMEAVLFMKTRYGFDVDWQDVLPIKNTNGARMKANQLSLPGIREMKR